MSDPLKESFKKYTAGLAPFLGGNQVSTMPAASANELGNIYQFVGATTSSYTNGYFYKCVSDGESTPTYSWEAVNVQEGGGSGVTDFDDLTNRPQESDEIDISDLDLPMPAKPTEYPVLFDETGTEYQVGLYRRASDGKVKPVWRKDFKLTNISSTQSPAKLIDHSDLPGNIEKYISYSFVLDDNDGQIFAQNIFITDTATVQIWMDGSNDLYYKAYWSASATYDIDVKLKYTKTTDEWKEV